MDINEPKIKAHELLAMLAHDLKNPIGAVFGYADILLDTPTGEGLSPKQIEILTRIRSTSSRCMELIRNYLYLAQSQDDKLTLRIAPLELNAAVRSVVDTTWREEAQAACVELELTDKPGMILADNFALERLIANLFSNALQYSPPNSKVIIKTFLDGEDLVLEINNQGTPISEQDLPHVFERYYRGSNSKGTRGSGLGLYIVKQIAVALGATLSVSSTQNGTTFRVQFKTHS